MKEYRVKKVNRDTVGVEDSIWDTVEPAYLERCRWNVGCGGINTFVKLLLTGRGLTVRFETDEAPLVAKIEEDGGYVCYDSCLEFFFGPRPCGKYVNIEVNPLLRICCFVGGEKCKLDRGEMEMISTVTHDRWILQYTVTHSFYRSCFGDMEGQIYGNFYKCGDGTGHKHYYAWSEVNTDEPNFHVPECFGRILLD